MTMNTFKASKNTFISTLYGKVMNVQEAGQLTDGFATMRKGRAYVSFSTQEMANLIDKHKCKLISFRYYAAGENVGLIFGPVYPAGFSKPEWICSDDPQVLDRETVQQLTHNDEYNVEGIKSHLYSAALLQKVLSYCTAEVRVYFGANEHIPALVIMPANISAYSQDDEICLDHGSLCPPDCYQLFE